MQTPKQRSLVVSVSITRASRVSVFESVRYQFSLSFAGRWPSLPVRRQYHSANLTQRGNGTADGGQCRSGLNPSRREEDLDLVNQPRLAEPAEQRRTATYRHERRSQPGRRRRRTGVRLVGSVAGFDPAVMAQVDGAVGSPVGDDDGADEADGPEDDADEGAPNGQSQARADRP